MILSQYLATIRNGLNSSLTFSNGLRCHHKDDKLIPVRFYCCEQTVIDFREIKTKRELFQKDNQQCHISQPKFKERHLKKELIYYSKINHIRVLSKYSFGSENRPMVSVKPIIYISLLRPVRSPGHQM